MHKIKFDELKYLLMTFSMLYFRYLLFFQLISLPFSLRSQTTGKVYISSDSGLNTDSINLDDNTNLIFKRKKPALSFLLDEKNLNTGNINVVKEASGYAIVFENKLRLTLHTSDSSGTVSKYEFENISNDTISISNVVPFGTDNESVNITGMGPPDLARAYLFRPGYPSCKGYSAR